MFSSYTNYVFRSTGCINYFSLNIKEFSCRYWFLRYISWAVSEIRCWHDIVSWSRVRNARVFDDILSLNKYFEQSDWDFWGHFLDASLISNFWLSLLSAYDFSFNNPPYKAYSRQIIRNLQVNIFVDIGPLNSVLWYWIRLVPRLTPLGPPPGKNADPMYYFTRKSSRSQLKMGIVPEYRNSGHILKYLITC